MKCNLGSLNSLLWQFFSENLYLVALHSPKEGPLTIWEAMRISLTDQRSSVSSDASLSDVLESFSIAVAFTALSALLALLRLSFILWPLTQGSPDLHLNLWVRHPIVLVICGSWFLLASSQHTFMKLAPEKSQSECCSAKVYVTVEF